MTEEIYEGCLDKSFIAPLHNPMLYKFQTEIKKNDSNNLHNALKLSPREFIIKEKTNDDTWNLDIYKNLINLDGDKKGQNKNFLTYMLLINSQISKRGLKKKEVHLFLKV